MDRGHKMKPHMRPKRKVCTPVHYRVQPADAAAGTVQRHREGNADPLIS